MQEHLVCATENIVLDRLEEVHSTLARIVWQQRLTSDRMIVVDAAEESFAAFDLG